MLNKEQSEVVAEALLSEPRAAQQAERERADARRRDRASRQSIAWFGLAGFGVGAAIGHLFLDQLATGAFVGIVVGVLIGRFVRRPTN